MKAKTFRELRDRLADPLLTALTIMLAILLFVIALLQAGGVVAAHNFGIVFGLVLVAAVFIVSESWIAVDFGFVAHALLRKQRMPVVFCAPRNFEQFGFLRMKSFNGLYAP